MLKTLASKYYEGRSKSFANRAEKANKKFNETIMNYPPKERFAQQEKSVKKVGSLMDQSGWYKRQARGENDRWLPGTSRRRLKRK